MCMLGMHVRIFTWVRLKGACLAVLFLKLYYRLTAEKV